MRLLLLLFLFLLANSALGQTPKVKVPSYFGLQVKPILPTKFIGNSELKQELNGFKTTFKQSTGYSFGAVVRAGLTKTIAIETGLNYNQRVFDIDMSLADSNLFLKNDMKHVSYDLPIKGLFYIRLAEKWYMSTAIGGNISYNPTNVRVTTNTGTLSQFVHTGLARKLFFEFGANVGFEFRTEKDGFFYLGGVASVPFNSIMFLRSSYVYQGYHITIDAENEGKVDGSYLSLEFKYFFPNIKAKKKIFQEGPIEQ